MQRFIQFSLVCLPVLLAIVAAKTLPAEEAEVASPFIEDARDYQIHLDSSTGPLLKLNEKSLLDWTNPVRQQERGAVYIWQQDGRPQVIGSLFTYEMNEYTFFKHEMLSLSTKPMIAKFGERLAWSPKTAGIEWKQFPKSPAPAANHTGRLLQMRQLARPFRAELVSPTGEKTELRLTPRPLYEYSSPAAGVVDGAIFSFTVATDPEVLLLIEATADRQAGYRYAFAPFHYWELNVYNGDEKVWLSDLDRTHERNNLGDPLNIPKPYNSFHAKPEVPTKQLDLPTTLPKAK
jgi:hypothetical protein